MVTLTISHSIFLADDERIALASGKTIEVMGISVPVWFYEGSTSEPAKEIFCRYILTNQPEDYPPTVLSKGYKFNLPQTPEGYKLPRRPSPKAIDEMTKADIEEWSIKNPMPATAVDLLDEEDGGIKSLHFKKYSKNIEGGKHMRVVHIIDIKTLEVLEKTMM